MSMQNVWMHFFKGIFHKPKNEQWVLTFNFWFLYKTLKHGINYTKLCVCFCMCMCVYFCVCMCLCGGQEEGGCSPPYAQNFENHLCFVSCCCKLLSRFQEMEFPHFLHNSYCPSPDCRLQIGKTGIFNSFSTNFIINFVAACICRSTIMTCKINFI